MYRWRNLFTQRDIEKPTRDAVEVDQTRGVIAIRRNTFSDG